MAAEQFGASFSILGPIGPQGLAGIAGNRILTGDHAPTNDIGQVGDLYIDLIAGDLYYPKTEAGWPTAKRNLIGAVGAVGARGAIGASLLQGYGPPDDTENGEDGDSYFDAQNASIWGPKANGAWPNNPTSLIGPAGNVGATGTLILAANGAPNDAQGQDGDFFIDTLDGRLYGPKQDGTWGNGLSLIGPMGGRGDQGVQGFAGQDGATILVGDGSPEDSLGKPTDIYIDRVASSVYGPKRDQKNSPWPPAPFSIRGAIGPAGEQGPAGLMGSDGKTLLAGASDPTDDQGVDGDFYFNGVSGYLIGPKANGHWPSGGFLLKGPPGDVGAKGPAGATGQRGPGFAAGAGAPTDDIGEDGTFYVDSAAFNIYGPKANGHWPIGYTALIGEQGPIGPASTVPGPQGPQGPRGAAVQTGNGVPANTLGQDGDVYVDTAAAKLYPAKSGGVWPPEAQAISLIGPAGAVGAQGAASTVPGPQGDAGYSLLTGGGPPSNSYGRNGDVYIDLNAGALYGAKNNGVWPTPPITLVGAAGAVGASGSAGAPGRDGTNGSILRYGMGPPSGSTVGNNGDFYIDQQFSRLYGPMVNSAWPSSFVSLVGPTGASGSLIVTGSGSPDNSVGSLGDIYIDLANGRLYGTKTQSGWPATFTNLVGATGKAGTSVLAGAGAPANSLGNVGDVYVDTAAGNLYGAKTASGWPGSPLSLVGATGASGSKGDPGQAGTQITYGTDEPGLTYGNVGDYYIRTTTFNLYYKVTFAAVAVTADYPHGWRILGSLIGPQGSAGATGQAGFSVQSGSGAPSPSLGNLNDLYVDTANGRLYPAKTSSGWPNSYVSLIGAVGPAGPQGDPGAVGATGPSSPGLRTGSGAPTSNNPSYQVDGDYYIRTDVSPYLLYGPRAAGAWPATGQNTGGSQTQYGNGPPAASVGAVGDVYYDLQNGLFYPPKQASGWTLSPINQVGPAGPSMQVQPTFGQFSQSWGPAGVLNNVTVSTTAQGAYAPGIVGMVQYHVPNTASAFVGGCIVNYSNSAGTLRFALTNNTTNTELYVISIARGTVQSLGALASTLYPMTAGNQYVWNVTGSGAAYCHIMPMYLTPSSFGGSVGAAASFALPSTALTTAVTQVGPPGGTAGLSGYYQNPFASYLFNVQALVVSTNGGTVQFSLYNGTSSTVIWTSTTIAGTTSGTQYNSGNMGINQAYIPVGAQCYWRAVGTGTVAASIQPYIAQ